MRITFASYGACEEACDQDIGTRETYCMRPLSTDRARAISLAHLNPNSSLKASYSAPRGDLDSPSASSLSSFKGKLVMTTKKNPSADLNRSTEGLPFQKTAATYSPTFSSAVPSALRGLTSLFGMGRGGSPVL